MREEPYITAPQKYHFGKQQDKTTRSMERAYTLNRKVDAEIEALGE